MEIEKEILFNLECMNYKKSALEVPVGDTSYNIYRVSVVVEQVSFD